MKQTAKIMGEQFNLPPISALPLAFSQDRQKELKRALIELLTSAASPEGESREKNGGADESQTNG
jgi:hypothetical protein